MAYSNRIRFSASVLVLVAHTLQAETSKPIDEPFQISNRNPFVQIYGVPAARSASILRAGDYQLGLSVDRANSSSDSSKGDESIVIDGETSRSALTLSVGMARGFELSATVPYYSHSGGSLDDKIENWHDAFGLPNGNRDEFKQDQLEYRYTNDDQVVGISDKAEGLGDISIALSYGLSSKASRSYVLQTQIKLPTGQADKLTGSDSTDIAAGLYFTEQRWLGSDRWVFHGSTGLLLRGDGDVIEQQSRNTMVFGSATMVWKYTDNISLKTQLDLHSAAYDSDLREFGYGSAQWSLGASFAVSDNCLIDVNINEDIAVRTSPDVVFQLAVRWNP